MPDYVHVTFTPGTPKTGVAVQGAPGPLPAAWLPFWKGNPADVLDLGPRGWRGQGYWPYTAVKASTDDPETEALGEPSRSIDAEAMTVTDTWVKVTRPLTDAAREIAKKRIDDEAEAFRLNFITPGAGQAMTYQEKRAEADRYVATEGAGDYPILKASVGIEGEDLEEVVALVHDRLASWTAIAAHVEHKRLGAKKAIDEAATWAELKSARAVDWMEGLPS